jgi:hypothetical protein
MGATNVIPKPPGNLCTLLGGFKKLFVAPMFALEQVFVAPMLREKRN